MYKEKKELPVLVIAILIFLSSIGFLGFAVYYITFLPVPMAMQPLKVRILTAIQVEESIVREQGIIEEDVEVDEESYGGNEDGEENN
jgi:hypothetical protein